MRGHGIYAKPPSTKGSQRRTSIMDWMPLLPLCRKILSRLWGLWNRPVLDLYFDKNETYHVAQTVNEQGALGFYCHLMVKNKGKSTAPKCRGRLIAVEMLDDDGHVIKHPNFNSPAVLKWAHEPDFAPKDIEPDLPRRLDLCYVISSRPQTLSFFTEKRPLGNRTDFDRGVYRVTVRIDGDNLRPNDGQFLVKHMGDWNSVEVQTLV